MSSSIREIEQALLALSHNERAAVIQRGIESLEATDKVTTDQIDSAWANEASRRLHHVKNDEIELLDLKESHRQLRAELAALREAS